MLRGCFKWSSCLEVLLAWGPAVRTESIPPLFGGVRGVSWSTTVFCSEPLLLVESLSCLTSGCAGWPKASVWDLQWKLRVLGGNCVFPCKCLSLRSTENPSYWASANYASAQGFLLAPLCHSVSSCPTKILLFIPLLPQTLVWLWLKLLEWNASVLSSPKELPIHCGPWRGVGWHLPCPALHPAVCSCPLRWWAGSGSSREGCLGCGSVSTAAFWSAVPRVYNTAALGSPHQEILAVPLGLRLPSFKMFFPSASERDEFCEQSQEGWV